MQLASTLLLLAPRDSRILMYSAATHSHFLWSFDPPSGSLNITPRHQPFIAIPASHSQLSSQVVGAAENFNNQPKQTFPTIYLCISIFIYHNLCHSFAHSPLSPQKLSLIFLFIYRSSLASNLTSSPSVVVPSTLAYQCSSTPP